MSITTSVFSYVIDEITSLLAALERPGMRADARGGLALCSSHKYVWQALLTIMTSRNWNQDIYNVFMTSHNTHSRYLQSNYD